MRRRKELDVFARYTAALGVVHMDHIENGDSAVESLQDGVFLFEVNVSVTLTGHRLSAITVNKRAGYKLLPVAGSGQQCLKERVNRGLRACRRHGRRTRKSYGTW